MSAPGLRGIDDFLAEGRIEAVYPLPVYPRVPGAWRLFLRTFGIPPSRGVALFRVGINQGFPAGQAVKGGCVMGDRQKASPCTASELRGHRIPARSPSGSPRHRSLQPGMLRGDFRVGLALAAWGRWSENLPPPLLPLPKPISGEGSLGTPSSAPAAVLAVGEGKWGLLPPRPPHEGG